MSEERMTVATVDICSCGLVMHQYDEDDYDTLGTDCSVLCPDCGNEKFTTIEQLQAELAKYRWIPVEERLPGNANAVLLVCNHYFYIGCCRKGLWYIEGILNTNVTHWKLIILPGQEVKP